MLTITYSIGMLSKEQQNARRILAGLEQSLHAEPWIDQNGISLPWLETVFKRLMKVNRYCHERKVELYLMPTVHKVSCDDASMFTRLDSINTNSTRILRYACDQAQRILTGQEAGAEQLVTAIELYCEQLHERFSLEEKELLPAAYRLLSTEEWFQIAAQCLLAPVARRKGTRQACYYGIPRRGQGDRPRYAH
ncbi:MULTISPECIES: hypothetical protein [Oxalobacteraceae]|jgi:hemerythrin-like domain-containing protein|uniref:hypothetical protein n=1 Tax=Oxalobacteraceae TaxID=75682 RepID=UPI0010A50660|nr:MULTISPECIES: hypothetical protein [Oxalobacteraceae]HJV52083.1 hypothetical protein [Noviherbaspirillum sp.]